VEDFTIHLSDEITISFTDNSYCDKIINVYCVIAKMSRS